MFKIYFLFDWKKVNLVGYESAVSGKLVAESALVEKSPSRYPATTRTTLRWRNDHQRLLRFLRWWLLTRGERLRLRSRCSSARSCSSRPRPSSRIRNPADHIPSPDAGEGWSRMVQAVDSEVCLCCFQIRQFAKFRFSFWDGLLPKFLCFSFPQSSRVPSDAGVLLL